MDQPNLVWEGTTQECDYSKRESMEAILEPGYYTPHRLVPTQPSEKPWICKSDCIIFLLKTFQWFSISLNIKFKVLGEYYIMLPHCDLSDFVSSLLPFLTYSSYTSLLFLQEANDNTTSGLLHSRFPLAEMSFTRQPKSSCLHFLLVFTQMLYYQKDLSWPPYEIVSLQLTLSLSMLLHLYS